jgi:hypothetical protein
MNKILIIPTPATLMEEGPAPYRPITAKVRPLDDPDFIGAEAALKRAAAKAVARDRAAGLEPVVRTHGEKSKAEALDAIKHRPATSEPEESSAPRS